MKRLKYLLPSQVFAVVIIFVALAFGGIGTGIDFSKPIAGPILLSKTTVSLAADGETSIYIVPSDKRCILSYAILVIGADAVGSDISIGQNGAETDFVPAYDCGLLDNANDAGLLVPIPAVNMLKLESYAGGTDIRATVTNQAGGSSNTLFLFGTLY